MKKQKLINEFECAFKSPVKLINLKPDVDVSMSFSSPRLDTANISLTDTASNSKITFFDKKNILQKPFSTSEATIIAAFEKGEKQVLLFNRERC